jgi:HNH endonuclease
MQLSVGSPWNPPYVRVRAHVFAWEQANGRTVPAGKVVMHSCDNPRCVNPAHLSVGTQRDNILDSVRKGRYNCFGIQKLNASQVQQIRALAARGLRQKDIAARFSIARNTVSGIVNRKSWNHLDEVRPFDESGSVVLEPVRSVQLPIRGELFVGVKVAASLRGEQVKR